jgi:hypothetical protein
MKEILIPSVIVLGMGLGGNYLMRMKPSNGISALITETPESSLTLVPPCNDTTRESLTKT